MSGINTNRTNISLPTDISAEIIAKVQEDSAVMKLARKIDLPGRGLTIPVITADPTAAWVAETDKKTVANPTLTQKVMQAYKLAVIVPFSNEFRRDLPALYAELVRRLPLALAQKFDATVFHGTAPGSNFDTFAACAAQTISGTGNSIYKALVAADSAIGVAGGFMNGVAMSAQGKGELLGAVDTTGRPLFINSAAEGAVPMLLGAPVAYSKAAYKGGTSGSGATPDVLGFVGDWTQAMYGTVEGVQIDISDQAAVTISSSLESLWERNMFAVRAEIELGFVADTACFQKITRTHA